MKNLYLLLAVGLTSSSCRGISPEEDKTYTSRPLHTHTIQRVDSLIFRATDSCYISRVGRVGLWRGSILISDFYQKKVFVFDKALRLQRVVGRKGKGPGEFGSFPGIVPMADKLALVDDVLRRVSFWSKDFSFLASRPLPQEYFIYRDGIYVGDKFVFPGNKDKRLVEVDDFRALHPLVVCDSTLNNPQELWDWDEVYLSAEPALWTYARANTKPRVALGPNGTFYANQEATWRIAHFGRGREVLKVFGLKPVAYKVPPRISDRGTLEKMSDYAGQTTSFFSLLCDTLTGFTFLNYFNARPDIAFRRTMLAGDHFLQVFNEDYDCVFDGPIPGYLAFVEDGHVVVLAEERPEHIKFLIYRLVEKSLVGKEQ